MVFFINLKEMNFQKMLKEVKDEIDINEEIWSPEEIWFTEKLSPIKDEIDIKEEIWAPEEIWFTEKLSPIKVELEYHEDITLPDGPLSSSAKEVIFKWKKKRSNQDALRCCVKGKQRDKEMDTRLQMEEKRPFQTLSPASEVYQKGKMCDKLKVSPESRYLRKKEQNKLAAVRYRLKRKQRQEEVEVSLRMEEQQRNSLEITFNSLKKEFSLLKTLMREVCVRKKLVPSGAFN